MSLTEISVPEESMLEGTALPPAVESLIAETEKRIIAFVERTKDDQMFAFVPSDFRATYRALAWLHGKRLAPGRAFCEWGSGMGAVALLAAQVGFDSSGIEVESALVEESIALAKDFDLPVDFVCGSFVPEGSEDGEDSLEEFAWLDFRAAPAYAELGYEPEDFDLIFAYPWPGEQQVVFDIFEECAANGALLLTYHGGEGLRLHRRHRSSTRY